MARNAAEIAGLASAKLSAPCFQNLGLIIDKRAAEDPTDALAFGAKTFSADFSDYTWTRKIQLFVKANNQNYDLIIKRYQDGPAGTIVHEETVAAAQTATGNAFKVHTIDCVPGQFFAIGIKNVDDDTAMDAVVYAALHG